MLKTELYRVDAESGAIFARAGRILREGGLVAFPTETVYGLGANALDADAAKKIYAAKGRPSDNPLIVHIADRADAHKYAHLEGKAAEVFDKLAEAFWPGPLTIVLPKRECIPDTVTGGLDSVAIRLPSDENARRLIAAAGVPVAAPSANRSGKPSPTTAAHVMEDMDGRIDMILDGGSCTVGLESTIVSVAQDGALTLLRPGGITLEMFEALGLEIAVDPAVLRALGEGEKPLAPGMKYRHYAPDTPLVLVEGSDADFYAFLCREAKEKKTGALIFDEDIPHIRDFPLTFLSLGSRSADEEARNLFARLRQTDACGCDVFYARLPDRGGLGLAVWNRILKAAGYQTITLK